MKGPPDRPDRETIKARIQAWIAYTEAHPRPSNEALAEVETELAVYERRYGMTWLEARVEIDEGRMEETFETCRWWIVHEWCERLRSGRYD